MPFNRPDLTTIRERIDADIRARMPDAAPELRRTLIGILAAAEAASVHGLYGYQAWIARQLLVDTAEAEMLDRHGSIWGVVRKAATAATGTITLTGLDGSVIPAGTLLQRADGAQFGSDTEVTIAAGTASAAITALEAGTAGNTPAAAQFSLISPVTGVDGTDTADAAGLTGGTDTEPDADYRGRIMDRIREAPHGGNANDYVTWALEVAGVTRAWCYPQELGPGTVTVRFVVDNDAAGPIPDAGQVAELQAYIDSVRPVTADVTVVAPIAVAIDPEIQLTPATAAVQAAVQTELADMLAREAEPGGTILLSHIREAISIAAGEADHVLISPAADVTHTTGEFAVLGTITWS